jgi:hypothetical protein
MRGTVAPPTEGTSPLKMTNTRKSTDVDTVMSLIRRGSAGTKVQDYDQSSTRGK